jgi:hypothetical protein
VLTFEPMAVDLFMLLDLWAIAYAYRCVGGVGVLLHGAPVVGCVHAEGGCSLWLPRRVEASVTGMKIPLLFWGDLLEFMNDICWLWAVGWCW